MLCKIRINTSINWLILKSQTKGKLLKHCFHFKKLKTKIQHPKEQCSQTPSKMKPLLPSIHVKMCTAMETVRGEGFTGSGECPAQPARSPGSGSERPTQASVHSPGNSNRPIGTTAPMFHIFWYFLTTPLNFGSSDVFQISRPNKNPKPSPFSPKIISSDPFPNRKEAGSSAWARLNPIARIWLICSVGNSSRQPRMI